MIDRPSTDLAIALDAAEQAGAVALRMQGGVAERTKADGSPVSDADLAADAAVRTVLATRATGDAILSEEVADSAARLAHRRVWIVDPIDGTRDYLEGRQEWAVQVALAVDGVLTASALAMPHDGVVVGGGPADGCWIRDAGGLRRFTMAPAAAQVLITSKSSRNREQVERVRAALPEFAWVPTTSVGVKVWRMLQGAADLFVHARQIHEWDVAAPAGVLAAAGGTATDLRGGALSYNTASSWCPGLVFSRRSDHAVIVERLRAAAVVLAG